MAKIGTRLGRPPQLFQPPHKNKTRDTPHPIDRLGLGISGPRGVVDIAESRRRQGLSLHHSCPISHRRRTEEQDHTLSCILEHNHLFLGCRHDHAQDDRAMLGLVSTLGGASGELEAVTAERDWFKEKYIEQISELEALRNSLKAEKRTVDKLRSQILLLEMEKAKGSASSSSSGTATTCDDDDSGSEVGEDTVISATKREKDGQLDVERESYNTPKKSEVFDMIGVGNDGEGSDDGDEGDDADDIRAKAERMLLWADYSTSKRTISMQQDSPSSSYEAEDESRHSSTLGDDDAANCEPASTIRGNSGSRLGQLFSNLKDVIDPEFDEFDELSDDD